jgi:chemotaxis protein methyltransferase CheR
VTAGGPETARFRELLTRVLGFQLDASRAPALHDLLVERAAATRSGGVDSYLMRLSQTGPSDPEVRALADGLTVTETYFLRGADQLRAFSEVALPDRMRAQSAGRTLRILSAGCASGEEAYSLAIASRAVVTDPTWKVSILGIDVNPSALAKASLGRYSTWSLRETPADVRERYFRLDGREFVLDPEVRAAVSLSFRNLIEDDPSFWRPGSFDIVFCRNVVMYFTPDVMRSVIARISGALCPGGFLFLGHAETLRGTSQDFHLRHTHDTFYYQRRESSDAAAPPFQSTSSPQPRAECAGATPALDDASWVGAIDRASTRIAQLARTSQDPPSRTPDAPTRRALDLQPAVELLRRERFAEAMDLLGALPTSSEDDPDAQLLRGVLLTNGSRLREAEQVCARILSADELNAGAHYLMALCREHAGDRSAAAEHDQMAAYLDPGFAMPHLHLGLMARRGGDLEGARPELARALELLAREDASRILLFGGGFSRDALLSLCRSELHACGGRSW